MSTSTNDPEFYQAPKFTPDSYQPPRQRGCFFYGCIIASILMVMVLVLIGAATYFVFRGLHQLAEQYTTTAPRELPKVDVPPNQRESLKKRAEEFSKAVEEGKAVEPLVLTGDDLNVLIEEEPQLSQIKGHVYLKIEGDELKGQVSIPLEKFSQVPGFGMLKGRYLDGEADIKASLNSGVLIITLDSIEVNGKRVPEEAMTNIRQENLAKDAYKNPKQAAILHKLESLEIKDGKMTIKVKAKPADATGKEAEKKLPADVVAPGSTKKDGAPPSEPAATKPRQSRVSHPRPSPEAWCGSKLVGCRNGLREPTHFAARAANRSARFDLTE